MESQQEAAGVGAVVDDPEQQAGGDEAATLAATLEGGGSWYWTSMLNFSQSGSSSTHTSAGQLAASQFTGSPPSSSSVHNNINPGNNNNNMNNNNNNQVDHAAALPLDSVLASNNNNDPENAVWGQDFLSGPIGESKPSMHACGDDGLQELLYPRTVRELLLDPSPSWDLLQQAAISKTFGFPLGPDDQLAPAQLHGLLTPDIKPAHVQGLHYSHDDRLSSNTASSTLSDNTLSGAEPHWSATQAGADQASQGRTCAILHVPHTTILGQQQFDLTRVKQEYPQLSMTSSPASCTFAKPININPFLLQHQQQQHSLRLINANQDAATLLNEAAAMASMQHNADVKPSRQLHSWPNSPSPAAIGQLCRSSSSFELGGLPSPHAADPHQLLLNSMKPQHHAHAHGHQLDAAAAGFPSSPNLPNLIGQDAAFFQPADHHQLMQQAAALQAHHHHHHAAAAAAGHGSVLNSPPLQTYLNHQQVGLKKARAHLEGGHVNNIEEGKDHMQKGADHKSISPHHADADFNFKRPRVEPQQQQQQQQQQHQQQQNTPGSTSSFKSQPARKEKLGERITNLQQLVAPFGKTDTASVLLEAIGYIKFLQDQVQTLSSPYLKSTNNPTSQSGDKSQSGEEANKPDLRSKGLCLVPLSCTMQVANDNGADYWYGGAFR